MASRKHILSIASGLALGFAYSIAAPVTRSISESFSEAAWDVYGPTTGLVINYYADSVSGDDGNDGLTPETAFETLGALETAAMAYGDGVTLGLARGSYWEEFLDLDSLDGANVYAYGTGDPPVVSGAIPIDPGDFSASGHGDAGGVVYEYAWTRGDGDSGGQDLVMVWEGDYVQSESGGSGDGTPSQNRLIRKTSVAACAAQAGTYYAPTENTGSSTVYVHPYGSTNPTSDGKVYYVTKHSAGLDGYSTSKVMAGVSGLHLRRSWGHYGPLQWGDSTLMEKLIVSGGGIHHTVNAGATTRDMVLLDHPKGYGQASVPFTAYIPDGSGKTHSAERVFVIGDDTANQTISGFLSHGSANPFGTVNWTQIALLNASTGAGADADFLNIRGGYFKTVNQRAVALVARDTVTVEYSIFNSCPTFSISDSGPVDGTYRDRIIRHCAIYLGSGVGGSPRNGSLTIENCIVVVDTGTGYSAGASTQLNITFRNNMFIVAGAPALGYAFSLNPGTGTLDSDNNVFIYPGGAGDYSFRFQDGAGYVQTLAAWQARNGTDGNSLSLYNDAGLWDDIFLNGAAGLAAGDFRINPSSGYTLPDGTNINQCGPQYHWDWNARAVAAGPPTAWPDVPETLAEAKTYIADPGAWDFYP